MAYEYPGLHSEGSRQDTRRVTFAGLLGEDDCKMVVPLLQRAYRWGSAESLHKASWHSVAGRMTSLVDGYWRDVAGEGVRVVAAQCREGHPQARYRETGERCSASAASRGAPDGQYMLLLASIQDAALRLLGQDALPRVLLPLPLHSSPLSLCAYLCLSLTS